MTGMTLSRIKSRRRKQRIPAFAGKLVKIAFQHSGAELLKDLE
jgi:hypothetical protein